MADDKGKKLADLMFGQRMDEGGAAFGVFPQMKPRRSKQDPEAAKDVPRQLLRGWAAGTLGLPGDIEGLVRMLPGLDETPRLPTSEFYLDYLPGKAQGPAGEAAAGLGTLFGGLGSTKVARGALKAGESAGKAGRAALETMGTGPSPGGLAAQRGVIKMPGGNWLSGNVERAVEPLKRNRVAEENLAEMRRVYPPEALELMSPETRVSVDRAFPQLEKEVALNKWIDSNLTNYIKKQMGTPDDPVRKLIEETGSAHIPLERSWEPESLPSRRKAVGFPIEGFAAKKLNELPAGANEKAIEDLEKAIEWESRTDQVIGNLPVKEWQAIANPQFEAANSWMSKVDPNTMAYRVDEFELRGELGFDHIIDVLREDLAAGRIRPEQLNKVSMEQAVRRTYEYDQELAKKMQEANAALRAGLPVYKEYPEKYRWIELNRPGAFASESEAMGHSVRGYEPPKGHPDWTPASGDSGSLGYGHGGWEAIKSGKAKVYSLVDEKGQPHVTVEVASGKHPIGYSFKGKSTDLPETFEYNRDFNSEYKRLTEDEKNAVLNRAKEIYTANPKMERMDAFQQASDEIIGRLPSEITQIKGKQNAAPKEEYLPYVQDFVKSGQWSDVGDLRNTGLRRFSDAFNENEIKRIRDAGIEVPTWATPDEIKTIGDTVWPGQYGTPPGGIPEGMARGGKVRFTDNPDAMRLELEKPAIKPISKAMGGAITADDLIIEERPL